MGFGNIRAKREFRDFLQQVMEAGTPPPPAPVQGPVLPLPVPPPFMPADIAAAHNLPTPNANIIAQMYGDTRPTPPPPRFTPEQTLNAYQTAPFQTYAPSGEAPDFMSQQWRIANDPEIARQIVQNNGSLLDPIVNTASDIGAGYLDFLTQTPSQQREDVEKVITGPGRDVANTVLDLYEAPLEKRKSMTGDIIYQEAIGEWDGFDDGVINWKSLVGIDPNLIGLPTVFQPSSAVRTPEQKAEVTRIYEAAEAQGQDGGAAVWEWYIGQFPMLQRALTDAAADPLNYPMALTPAGNAIIRTAPNAGRFAPVVRTVGQILKAPEVIADAPFEVPAAIVKAAGWRGRTAGKLVPDAITSRGPLASSPGQIARDEQEELIRQGRVATSLMQTQPDGSPSPYLNRAEQMTAEQTAAREAEIAAEAARRVRVEGGITPRGEQRLIPGDQGPVPQPVVDTPPVTTVADETDEIIARANILRSDGTQVGPTSAVDFDFTVRKLEHPRSGNTIGWTATNRSGQTRRFDTKRRAEEFVATVREKGFNPWEVNSQYGGPSPSWTATNVITGEKRTFRSRDDALAFVGEQEFIGPTPVETQPSAVTDIDPSVRVAQVDSPPPARTQPETTMPEQDPVGVDFTLNPRPEGSRAVDVLAREQPHVFPRVSDQVRPWVESRYQPNRNLLRKDELTPEQEVMRQAIPGAEPYMPPPPSGRQTKAFTRYQGTNKALSQVLDAEAFGRIRLSTYLNGGNLDNLRWTIPPNLVNNRLTDDALATLLKIPKEQTRKGLTKESVMAHYLVNTNPEAEAAYVKWLDDNGVFFVPREGRTAVTPEEQRALQRYTYAQTVKPWATGDTAVLDEIITAQGLQKQPVQVNPADTARMPKVEEIATRGDGWTADRFDTVNRLPDEVKAPIFAEVAPWAEDAYRGIETASPRVKAFTDLEFAARLRESAAQRGVALQLPTSIPYDPDYLDDVIRAAVQEPDSYQADRIVAQLRDIGQVRYEPPVDYLQSLDPSLYATQARAFENYARIMDLRERLHAPASDIIARMGPVQGPPAPALVTETSVPQRVVSQKDFQKRIDAEIKRIRKEWAADPSKGLPTKGDNLLAAALADGRITEEEAAFFRQKVTITTGTKNNPIKRETTVFDLFVDQSLADGNVTLADAVRSVEDILAKSKKLTDPELRRSVAGSKGIVLQKYDAITKMYRDMYLYNPASVIRNGLVDSLANSFTQMLEGHVSSGFRSLPFISPRAHLAMYKHNMTGADLIHPTIVAARNWDVQPGGGVIDVVTRELDEVGQVAYAKVPVVGPVLKRGQALRHTSDQVNRANLWGDEFGRQMKAALHGGNDPGFLMTAIHGEAPTSGFYDRVIGVMGGGPQADEAVANLRKLEDMGGFLPSDVKRITGSDVLMKDWRRTSREVGQAADKEVNRVFFSYRQTNADAYTRRVFMFHYWMSRALVQHTRLTLSNPLLLYRYTQLWEGLDREAKRQGVTGPMAPLQMYFEWMRSDGGMYGISNPIAVFTPFSMFADAMTSYGNETEWDKFWRSTGAFLLPQIQGAAVVFGLSNRYPDFLGTASFRRIIRTILDWDRNSGYNILNNNPGVTGDPVQHYFNVGIRALNRMIDAIPGVELDNAVLPNLEKPQQDVAANLVVEQAEEDFGVPYMKMTPAQKAEVDAAIWALRNGASDNDRANEALAEMSDANLYAGALNTVLPGGMRARSDYQQDNNRAIGEYMDGGNLTPAVENAFDVNQAIQSGSPEVSDLNLEAEQLREIGTPLEKAWYDGFNEIAYSRNLDPNGFVVIAGRIYRGYEMNQMSSENRLKLAKAWLLDNGSNYEWLESYKGKRDAFTAGQDQLPDYRQYQKDAGKYEGGETYTYEGVKQTPVYQGGGIRAMREDLEGGDPAMTNPNFARAIGEERELLIEKGLSGEELEEALDMWAISPEGYNAYRGKKNRQNDPEPLPLSLDPTNIPPSIAQPESADAGGTGGGGSAASSGSSGVTERKMPKWQVDLVNEWTTYTQAVTAFEAEYGEGAINNYRFNPQVLDRYIPKPSAKLREYLEWASERQAKSQPYAIEDYLAFKDAEYEAGKEQQEKDREQAESTLGGDSTPETVEELLDEVDASQ